MRQSVERLGQRPAGQRPAGQRPAGQRPAGQRPAGQRPGREVVRRQVHRQDPRPARDDPPAGRHQGREVKAVVVWRPDRLGRTAKGLTALFDELVALIVDIIWKWKFLFDRLWSMSDRRLFFERPYLRRKMPLLIYPPLTVAWCFIGI